jgi:hypothetical protein
MKMSLPVGVLRGAWACAAGLALSALASGRVLAGPAFGFAVTLTPITAPDQRVQGMEVQERIEMGEVPSVLSLVLPLAMPGAPRNADAITALVVRDAAGEVAMHIADVDGATFPLRRWTTQRPVRGQVVLRYHAGLWTPQAGGPPYGMKVAGRGVAGSTKSFLLLPEGIDSGASRLSWDLSRMAPGAVGVSTTGAGTQVVPGPPSALDDEWLLAGPALAGQPGPGPGFNAYVIGTLPFDATQEMAWARRAYDALAEAYGYLGRPSYTLLIRALDVPSLETGTAKLSGGGALITVGNVFSSGYSVDALRSLIVHEMGHQWAGQLTSGVEPWFAEGFNVFAESTVPCRAGVMSWSACAARINAQLGDLYRSEGRRWSLQRIDAAGFDQEAVRRVPYARGMLYFAGVDAQLRQRSAERRGLLDAMRPLFAARQAGGRFEQQDWEAFVARELGPQAVDTFRAVVIDGSQDAPMPEDLFGPQLRRVASRWQTPQGEVDGDRWEAVR